MVHMLKVVNVENAPLMGEVVEKDGQITIRKPRLLQNVPGKGLGLIILIGDPVELTIPTKRVTWMYEARDEALKKAYVESTSGLSVVSSLVAAGLKN